MSQALNILLIDDDDIDRQFIRRKLANQNIDIQCTEAASSEAGITLLKDQPFDVVLLDFRLANQTGLEVLQTMSQQNLLDVPVIILSGMEDDTLMLKCLEHGAQDYLVKDEVNSKILLRAIHYAKERKQLQTQLLTLAKQDPLTGLANRERFNETLIAAIGKAKRRNDLLAVLFIDLDHFKEVNDTLGHSVGDKLLISVSQRLKNALRQEDVVARLGGDEFAILTENIKDPDNAAKIAKKIIMDLQPPHACHQHEIRISPSIGIAHYPHCGSNFESLLQAADTAMYEAKKQGRNNFRFFSLQMQQKMEKRLALENALRQAIKLQELDLYYQPQIEVNTLTITAMEALLRWENQPFDEIPPDQFIKIAEESGMIDSLGAWVLYQACLQSKQWADTMPMTKPLDISVNVSLQQLKNEVFFKGLTQTLALTTLNPSHLVIEITESIIADEPKETIALLQKIHDLGVRIAIDDFGTGYSSLSYLRQLPIDILKIDQSFIADIGNNEDGEAIVKTIISLAHNLRLHVIAEGVETQTQVDFLKKYQCDSLQGYYFSQPMNSSMMQQYLEKERKHDCQYKRNKHTHG